MVYPCTVHGSGCQSILKVEATGSIQKKACFLSPNRKEQRSWPAIKYNPLHPAVSGLSSEDSEAIVP